MTEGLKGGLSSVDSSRIMINLISIEGGRLWFSPRLLIHKGPEVWAATILGTVIPHFAESTRRDEVGLEAFVTLPRAMFLCTMGAGGRSLTVCRHVVELLTPCALRRHVASLIGFYTDFYVTQMCKLCFLQVLWKVV
jgi:hypothetical protein